MNSQLLAARAPQARRYSSTALERLARRTGLALVRWSSRRAVRPQLSTDSMLALRAAAALRTSSQRDTQLVVLLNRGQL